MTIKSMTLLLATMLALLTPPLKAEPILVGDGESRILKDMFAAILKNADIDVSIETFPPERKRRLFEKGTIVIDCCAMPQWRTRPEEERVQLWSVPFFTSHNRYIFSAERSVTIHEPADLADYRVATVLGFKYELSPHFGEVLPVQNWDAMLQLVEKGRADVGFIGDLVFQERQTNQKRDLVMGPLVAKHPLSVRVHKSRADLLPIINRSIAELIEKDVFFAIGGLGHQ